MRKLALFSAAFGAASLVCAYLLDWRAALWPGLTCALFSLLCFVFRDRVARTRFLLSMLGLSAGFLWFFGWSALTVAPAEDYAGTTQTLHATALDYVTPTDTGGWVDVRMEGIPVRLYLRGELPAITPGDTISVEADLTSSHFLYGQENTYYTSRAVFLLAYAAGEDLTVTPCKTPLTLLPRVWAKALRDSLDGLFSPATAGVLKAITLGDKTGLSDGQISLFNRTGLSHLLVVSGLHMTLLLTALTRLFRSRRVLLLPVATPILVLMVLLVGCTPSAIRAAVMSSLTLLAPLLKREYDRPTALFAALLLLLLQNPYAAAGVSLQLSFASVAGILLLSQPLQRWFDGKMPAISTQRGVKKTLSALLRAVSGSLSVTLGAMVFTVPLTALHFGVISLIAPLSNLLSLWAVGPLFVCALLSALLNLLSPWLTLPVSPVAAGLARFLLWMAELMGTPSFAAISLSGVYYRLWLLATYLLLVLAVLLYRRGRRILIPLCLPVVLLCFAALFTHLSVVTKPLTVTALDVGQGSSTAFYSSGATVLVDCGGSCPEGAGDVAADYFQSLGESTLDLLVITHPDSDHVDGAAELFARMEVRAVALPGGEDPDGRRAELERLAAEEGAEVWTVTRTARLTAGDCTITIYPPVGTGSTNEAGLFFLCSAGDFDVLVTGDAGHQQESTLLQTYALPDIELLIVGHHGSKTSTSALLLHTLAPEYAFISVGYNSYGHPHGDVLARLSEAGVQVWRTDEDGSILLTVAQDGAVSVTPR